jgi:hypothetical protein
MDKKSDNMIREIINKCRGSQLSENFFDEIETADPCASVAEKIGASESAPKVQPADGGLAFVMTGSERCLLVPLTGIR